MSQLRLRLLAVSALVLFTTALALLLAGCSGSSASTAPPPAPTPTPAVTLSSSSAQINAGDAVTLTWNAANATSVSITPDIGVPAPLPMQGTAQVKPTATTTYTITASGAGGSTTATTTVTVNSAAPAPTATITVSPATMNAGDLPATLTWNSTNATSVTINPPVEIEDVDVTPLSASVQVAPAQTTTYVITATGPGGTATAQTTLTVNQVAPTISLSLDNASITPGQSATLTWSTTNATALTIDNGVTVADPKAGSFPVHPAQTTTFTATATGPGGTATQQITLNVSNFTATLSANPTTLVPGGAATLTWNVTTDPGQSATISIDNSVGTNLASQGTAPVKPTNTTTYTLTATETNGQTRTATATVIVNNGLQSIKHIIFLVQENRSFDNYFSKLGLYKASKGLPNDVDGINDDTAVTLLDGAGQPIHPYHFQTVCHEGLTPSWDESHSDVNKQKDGTYKMDGFARIASKFQPIKFDPTGVRAMGYYDQRDLPYYYELATQFAISDRMYSPVLAATIPNRIYLFTGTSNGTVYPFASTTTPGTYEHDTIFDRLQAAGVTWRYYYQDSSVFLASFPKDWGSDTDPANPPNLTFRGKVRNIAEFFTLLADPNADKLLPQVIFLERGSGDAATDEHPTGNAQKGAAAAATMINALMQSKAWPTSVFFLTYDEAGGLYDHVGPMKTVAPDDVPVNQTPTPKGTKVNPGDFTEAGMRVPFIAVSPFVKPHYVSHVPRDTTSILKFIETRFALTPLTRRDAAQDDLTEMFDFANPAWLTPPPSVLSTTQPTTGTCQQSLETAGSH